MALTEGAVLDGLDLNAGGLTLEGLLCPPPRKRGEWATSADVDGAALIRDPLSDNREVVVRVRADQQATMDQALAKIAALSRKLEEAEQNPDGLGLVWTPAQATGALTFYVLSGQIEELPIETAGDAAGWFVKAPVATLRLTAKSAAYGDEVIPTTVANLVTNPSFEVDTAGWVTTGVYGLNPGATLTRVTTQKAVGTAAAQVDTTPGSFQGIADHSIDVVAGVTYQATAYVKGNAGGEQLFLGMGGPLGAGGASSEVNQAFTATTSWQRITVTFTPTISGQATVFVRTTASGGTYRFFVDGALCVAASSVPTYFDGTFPDAYWTGTAHASTSTRLGAQANLIANPNFETGTTGWGCLRLGRDRPSHDVLPIRGLRPAHHGHRDRPWCADARGNERHQGRPIRRPTRSRSTSTSTCSPATHSTVRSSGTTRLARRSAPSSTSSRPPALASPACPARRRVLRTRNTRRSARTWTRARALLSTRRSTAC